MTNKVYKKMLISIILLSLIINLFIIDAMSTDIPEIYLESQVVRSGEIISVPLVIKNNSGIAAFRFWIDYDTNILTPIIVEKSDITANSSLYFDLDEEKSGTMSILWYNTEDIINDGSLIILKFIVSQSVSEGQCSLNLRYRENDISNDQLETIPIIITEGNITICNYIIGDLNGDNSINLRDVFALKMFIAFARQPDETERLAADVNGDGVINILDSFELSYRIANGKWRS